MKTPRKSIIKKVFQAGILSTALVTQNTVFTSCTQPSNQQIVIPNEEQTQDIVSIPYNKRIGNGNYIIHNFIGKEPKIAPFTAYEDIQNYYDMGEKYIEATYHKFHQTFSNRSSVANFFRGFTLRKFKVNDVKITKGAIFDRMHEQIEMPCAYALADIVRHLDKATDREAFMLCFATLANEGYREGLSENRNENHCLRAMGKYYTERNRIQNAWYRNERLCSTNYTNDVDESNCRRITSHMDALLDLASHKMYSESNIDVYISDLRNLINIALLTYSWNAMDNYTAKELKHSDCNIENKIQQMMEMAHRQKTMMEQSQQGFER